MDKPQSPGRQGLRIFTDQHGSIHDSRGRANIDHVVVGPSGVVVVETKMRARPADKLSWENRVTFDGKILGWPRCPDDSKTLWQVRRNAEWLESYLVKSCGFSGPVKQVVAIPGWRVVEAALTNPRIVSGKGAGQAVHQVIDGNREARFSPAEVTRIVIAIEALCQDVEV